MPLKFTLPLWLTLGGGLNGGIDLLLVSWDMARIYPTMRYALEALRQGRLDSAML